MIVRISEQALSSVAISPHASPRLATASWDDRIRLLRPETGEPIWERPLKGATEVAFADEKLVAATSRGTVVGFNADTGKRTFETEPGSWVTCLCPRQGAGVILVGRESGALEERSAQDGALVRSTSLGTKITRLQARPGVILAGTDDGSVFVLDGRLRKKERVKTVGSVSVLAGSDSLVLAGSDSRLFFLAFQGKRLESLDVKLGARAGNGVAISHRRWVISSWKTDAGPAVLRVMDAAGAWLASCRDQLELPFFGLAVAGDTVAAVSMTGELVLWKPRIQPAIGAAE